MTISTPPTTPNPADPGTFDARASAWVAWWLAAVPEINALSGMTNSGKFLDGTAALPGITFTSDTDTGFSRPGANQIGISTGGTQRALLSTTALQLDLPLTGTAVTQSSTDSTSGRVMRTGAGGVLLAQGTAPAEYAFDTWGSSPSGAYWFNDSGDAGPLGLGFGSVLAFNYATTRQNRIVLNPEADRMFIGYIDSASAQSPWTEMYGQRSILGTVSQSSGVPTGKLIETGSNANGRYVRFADGTQICWSSGLTVPNVNTADGSLYRSSSVSWTFPAAFSAAPNVPAPSSPGNTGMWGTVGTLGATSVAMQLRSTITDGSTRDVNAVAIGRWF